MRSEGNPLDLNNLPEDYSRDGKLTSEDTSSSAAAVYRKKKSGGKDDSSNSKVYECRFCSLKFCKSQALGGHMNRHRQERETETLNKARQLVFTNDHLPPPHLGYVSSGQTMGDPSLPFRPLYPTRLFPTSSPLIPPPPPPPASYMYTSPSRVLPYPAPPPPPVNDYFMGHVLSNEGNYTCIGAPVGHGFQNGGGGGVNEEEGMMKWGRR